MNDETLKRRAEIIESLYRDGIQRIPALADSLDMPPEEVAEDVAALAEAGAVVLNHHERQEYYLSDKAIAAMNDGARVTARCVARGGTLANVEATIVAFGACAWDLHAALRAVVGAAERGRELLADLDANTNLRGDLQRAHRANLRRVGHAVPLPPDWPHVTLADCAAWAEAIVQACEAYDWMGECVYQDALFLQRAIARPAPDTGTVSVDWMRGAAREYARARLQSIARAYSAIIAVRMLAADAAERES